MKRAGSAARYTGLPWTCFYPGIHFRGVVKESGSRRQVASAEGARIEAPKATSGVGWGWGIFSPAERVGRSESRCYWTCCWRVAPASTRLRSRWRRTFRAYDVQMMWLTTCLTIF